MLGKLVIVAVLLLTLSTVAQELKVLNSSSPGELFELERYLERDTMNIVVFRSRHSPPCLKVEEALQQLYRGRDDLVVRLVDIDRKDSEQIDWRSPLARQFNLRTLPYIRIINKQKETVSEGYQARKDILEMLDGL